MKFLVLIALLYPHRSIDNYAVSEFVIQSLDCAWIIKKEEFKKSRKLVALKKIFQGQNIYPDPKIWLVRLLVKSNTFN